MLVFIHINKTAGRTIRYMLRSTYGLQHCEAEPWKPTGTAFTTQDLVRLRKVYPALKSIAGHTITGYADLQENGTTFKYFTFMRDPLKTSASRFQYNVQYRGKKDLVFEDWIQQDWARNAQTKRIAGTADVEAAIRVIRQKSIFVGLAEHFDESVVLLKALLAKDLDISYKRVNVARDNSIKDQLLNTEATRKMLIEANQADIALYRYVNEELYPQQKKDYGNSLESAVADYQNTRNNSFNNWNLTLSRMKQFGLYKPLLFLSHKGFKVV